jgi:hypothetical protein
MALRLNGQTSGYVELEAPATAGNNTLVLPTGNGTSGQVLTTNGSGTLSWSQLQPSALGSGMVLNVQHYSDVGSSTSSTSFTNANTSVFNYTPVSTNSTLILIASFGAQINNVASTNAQSYHGIGESGSLIGSGYSHRSFSASGGIGLQSMGSIQVDRTNTSLTTRAFQMMHAVNGAGQSVTTNAIRMTIMEVAN